MLKFNIMPKARKLSEEIQYGKEPFKKDPLQRYLWLYMVVSFSGAMIAGVTGHGAVCFIFLGLIILGFAKNAMDMHIHSCIGLIMLFLGIKIIGGVLSNNFGVISFNPSSIMPFFIVAFIICGVVMPLPRYFAVKKRAEKCTERVIACLNDGHKDINSIHDISKGTAFDLGKSSWRAENLASGNSPDSALYEKYGIEYDHDMTIMVPAYRIRACDYVYSYEGNRYALNLNSTQKMQYADKCGKRMYIYVDPENPEDYYSPDITPPENVSSVIVRLIVFGMIAAAFVFR